MAGAPQRRQPTAGPARGTRRTGRHRRPAGRPLPHSAQRGGASRSSSQAMPQRYAGPLARSQRMAPDRCRISGAGSARTARSGARSGAGFAPAPRCSLAGRKRELSPSRGTLQESRRQRLGQLADQPLELDRGPPLHRLRDPEVAPLDLQVAHRGRASTRNVLVLNTRHRVLVEAGRHAGSSRASPAGRSGAPGIPPRRPAPCPPPPRVSGSTWSRCQPSTSGSTAGAQVVEVCDHSTRPPAVR